MKKSFILTAIIASLFVSVKSNAQIDTAWTHNFGDVYWEEMHSVVTDQNGNAYVAGWTYKTSSDYDWAVARYNANGTQQWFRSYSYNPDSDLDATELIASDPNGGVVVAGHAALNLIKVIKYNEQGDTVWTAFNSNYYGIHLYTIYIDDAGRVYIDGFYDSPRKGVLLKYDQNGTEQWSRVFSSPSSGYCEYADVVTDITGNIYVCGRCEYDTNAYDALLVKYNPAGDTLWVKHWNGPGTEPYDEAVKIRLDALNNIYIGGRTSASLQTTMNFVTLKYDTAGNLQWKKYFNGIGNGNDGIVDMVVDDLGNVIVTGWTLSGSNNFDFETIKYHSNGDTIWARRFGGIYNEFPTAMIIDDSKNVYITGYGINAAGQGGWNGITIKYDASGNTKWVAEYDGGHSNGEDDFYDLALDNNNDLIVTGRSQGDITSYDFLTIKYKNSASGIQMIEYGNPDIQISCYPNPFSTSTYINYYLPDAGEASLKIYDLLGNEVKSLVEGMQQSGNHTLQLNGDELKVGVYFCQFVAGNKKLTQKLIIIK